MELIEYEKQLGKEIGVTFCEDIAEDGDGSTPWEVPAEPEPLYFDNFPDALKAFIKLLTDAADKTLALEADKPV